MFDTIAPRYDLVNRFMTFGLDGHWRRRTIALLDMSPGSLVADIGSGTGDLARALVKAGHRTVGLDLSMGMLRAAQPGGPPMVLADAAMMPFEDRAVDAAVSGFALRNFAELHAVVVEIARVVRPGGRIALLEVALPEHPLMKLGHSVWFNHVVPRIGAALSDAAAYRYLPASVAYLPGYSELAGMLGDAGFTSMRRDMLSGGVVQVVTATRAGFRPVTGPMSVIASATTHGNA
jgi:demethylmenaquinone methyltransferase/2-methoxy-6-polyprenyl-1,4-benzoquinol methylase